MGPKKLSLVLTSMTLNGGWLYIDGHLDLRPVKRWPHSITDDDLKAVIAAFLTATARVSPNLNPHAHCHDVMAPFSITGERMNVLAEHKMCCLHGPAEPFPKESAL